ncbi:AAA family ATPase [Cryobacterium melibiosiphilum]|nr:AAA family ATPase [Cryobacterium melibiosiphilum]
MESATKYSAWDWTEWGKAEMAWRTENPDAYADRLTAEARQYFADCEATQARYAAKGIRVFDLDNPTYGWTRDYHAAILAADSTNEILAIPYSPNGECDVKKIMAETIERAKWLTTNDQYLTDDEREYAPAWSAEKRSEFDNMRVLVDMDNRVKKAARAAAVTERLERLEIEAEAKRQFNAKAYNGLGGVISWDDLESFTTQPWLVDSLISLGEPALLISKRNVGKSMLSFALGWSIAMGMPFLGKETQQGKVMFILGEGVRGYKKRMNAWCSANNVNPDDLRDRTLVYSGGNLSNDTSIGDMRREALKFDPILIVLDTWTAVSGVIDEKDQSAAQVILNMFKTVAPDAARLILHHPNAETENTEAPSSRGGTALPSGVETVITMFYDKRHVVAGMPGEQWIAISTEDDHAGKQKEGERFTIHGLRVADAKTGGKYLDHHDGSTLSASDQWVTAYIPLGIEVTVPECVDKLGQSKNTVRTHLQNSRLVIESGTKVAGATGYIRTA